MTPPREPTSIPWPQLVPLLDAALDKDGDAREAYLDELAAKNPQAAAQLRAILAGESGPAFLDSDAVAFAGPAWQEETAEGVLAPGGRIGPYRIVRRLAVGGMSTVHLVERDDDQFERTAVLKVLDHVGLDPNEALRRFEAERRILATLDHPNIASVYDGGLTPEGKPYLILEYVPGEPITEYCARRRLSVPQRLELFETVCRAVQHAHRRLVVHRDLKPGNIFVREDGTVKLLDFGIAKLLDDTSPLAAPATRTGLRLLTPEYAAPEQVRGGPITSSTDVYALGVLLHELLTGARPHSLENLSPAEMERTVCEVDPRPPSTRGITDTAGLPGDATRALRGDLDTIVLKALRKEPTERYDSPRDLADDLVRHRTNLPIEARAASLPYRTRRFLRRHRVAVLVAAAVVAFGVFHLAQMTRERNLARQEALKAEQVSTFLKELFEVSDPDVSHGETVTARDLLDRATVRIRNRLADQPEVRGDMLMVLGDVHKRLSLYRRGVPLVEEAYRVRRDVLGATHPGTARTLELLGILHLELGHYAEADSLLGMSLAARRARLGEDHLETSHAWQALGVSALNQNEYARADSLFSEALRIRRRLPPGEQVPTARTLKDLGMVRTFNGDPADAEALLREALDIRRRLLGPDHSDTYIAMTNLGDNLSYQGRFEEAIPLLQRGTDGLERVLGGAHSEVAEGLNVLGITFSQVGRYAEARDAFRRALDMRRALHGDRHPDVARGLNDLSVMHIYIEDYAAAEPLLRESHDINRALSGDDAVVVAIGHQNLGRALLGLDRYDEALDHFRAAEASHVANFGADHIRVARARLWQAEVHRERGQFPRAETLYRELMPAFREAYPEGSPRLALLLLGYGRLLTDSGRTAEALPLLEEAEAQYLAGRGGHSMETAKARLALAHCLAELGEWRRAVEPLHEGLEVAESVLPPEHPLLQPAWADAAAIHAGLGQLDRARDYRSRLR